MTITTGETCTVPGFKAIFSFKVVIQAPSSRPDVEGVIYLLLRARLPLQNSLYLELLDQCGLGDWHSWSQTPSIRQPD